MIMSFGRCRCRCRCLYQWKELASILVSLFAVCLFYSCKARFTAILLHTGWFHAQSHLHHSVYYHTLHEAILPQTWISAVCKFVILFLLFLHDLWDMFSFDKLKHIWPFVIVVVWKLAKLQTRRTWANLIYCKYPVCTLYVHCYRMSSGCQCQLAVKSVVSVFIFCLLL